MTDIAEGMSELTYMEIALDTAVACWFVTARYGDVGGLVIPCFSEAAAHKVAAALRSHAVVTRNRFQSLVRQLEDYLLYLLHGSETG